MTAKIDAREFNRALQEYEVATGKDLAEILNRAGRNVALRSAQFTPVADRARVKSDIMRDPHLRYALTSIALKRRGVGKLPSPQFQKEVDKLVARRVASSKYLRAAWATVVQKFGGTFRGQKFKGVGGDGKLATSKHLIATLEAWANQPTDAKADSAENILLKAIQNAIDFVAKDMLDYSQKKLAQTARKYSAK